MSTCKLFMLIPAIFLLGCAQQDQDDPYSGCKYAKPEAIFAKDLPGIAQHNFRLKKQEAVEKVVFESGKELTVIQSGCDAIRQEFQFRLEGQFNDKDPVFWLDQSTQELIALGNLGPDFLVLSSWGRAISEKAEQLQLGESIEVQPGFYARIDKIVSSDHAILIVILSETP